MTIQLRIASGEMSSRSTFLGPLCLAFTIGACSKKSSDTTEATVTAPAAPSAAASAQAVDPNAVCTVVSRESWGKWPNGRTGLTLTRLGSRAAVGFALGNQPHVLVVEKGGETQLVRAAAGPSSALAKDLKGGRRDLQRVTPGLSGGRTVAYADQRDTFDDGRRRVACGRADGEPLAIFEGKPLIDDKKAPDTAAAASASAAPPGSAATGASALTAAPSAAAPAGASAQVMPATPPPQSTTPMLSSPRGRGFRRHLVDPDPAAAAPPPAAPPAAPPAKAAAPPAKAAAPAAATPATPSAKSDALREIRDCRTFVDSGGENPWVAGTELSAERKPDGSTAYRVAFFADPGGGRERVSLRTLALPKEPKAVPTFESPTAQQLGDGSWMLATRQDNVLYAWIVGADKRPRRPMQAYRGGYPTLPRFLAEGSDYLFVFSKRTDAEHSDLSFGRISAGDAKLPATLSNPALGDSLPASEPALARAGSQLWLSYQAGDRRKASLVVLPVDANLAKAGAPYTIAPSEQAVTASLVVGLDNGELLAVYIKSGEPTEIVSELLRCNVKR